MMMREVIAAQSGMSPPENPVQVNHNLAAIPEFVFITAKSTAKFWLDVKTSSYVRIRCDTSKADFEILCIVDHSIIK